MSQILLTTITNPLDPFGSRTVCQAIWTPGMTVADCVAQAFPLRPDDFDVAAGLNGAIVPDDRWGLAVQSGDCITVCAVVHGGGGGGGGGKNVVRAVAMLAVIIAAPYAAAAMGLISGGIGMAGMTGVMAYSAGAALSLTGMAVAAGVAVAGMALVNALLPPALPEVAGFSSGITNFAQSSPTYGWDQAASNQDQENIALPVLYGSARVKPPRIAKWVETIGDKQYLNMLFAVAGHAVDSIGDVEINKTPASMFTGVATDVRLGALDQTAIPWFHAVAAEQFIGRRISTSAVQMLTENSLVDKIRVALVCPNGLFFANDGGGLDQVNLQIVVRYRQSGGAWDTRNITMAGSQNTALRQMVDIDVNPALTGPYEVEAYFSVFPPSGSRYMTNCYVEYLQEVTNLAFTYPGVSLLAVRALATDQLSGAIPTITCVATRSTVQVWDPDAGAYVAKPATNPAWQDYDVFHNSEYGGDVAASRMTYADYDDWATWCTANNLSLSIYFDTTISVENADAMIGQVGRGRVVQRGTDFSCLVDRPGEVVQLFTVGNIKADSFKETFLDLKDRANVIEVTFWDSENDDKRITIELRSPLMADGDEIRKASATLYGSVSRELATYYGYHRLACNDYFLRNIQIEVDVDAIACQVNDVIAIQHDVPQWGYGGRIVSATAGSVVLDREVTIDAGHTCHVMVRSSQTDVLEERTATNAPGTTDTLTIVPNWTSAPVLNDVWSFGRTGAVTKPFRVLAITRATDMTRKITGLEYRSEVYQIPTQVPQIEQETDFALVAGVAGRPFWTVNSSGQVVGGAHLYWHGQALCWSVYQYIDSVWVHIGTTTRPFFDVTGLVAGTHTFAVHNTSAENQVSIPLSEAIDPPTNLSVSESLYSTNSSAGYKTKATLFWTQSDSPYAVGYIGYHKVSTSSDWIEAGRIASPSSTSIDILDIAAGLYDFAVSAIHTTGFVGEKNTIRKEIFALSAKPQALTGLSLQVVGSNAHLQWTRSTDLDVLSGGSIEFRHSNDTSGNAVWEASRKIGDAIAGASTSVVLPALDGVYFVRAVDSSGNPGESSQILTSTASIVKMNAIDSLVQDPVFAGTKTDMEVSGGSLFLAGSLFDSDALFDSDIDFDFGDGAEAAGSYEFENHIDLGSVVTFRATSHIIFTAYDINNLFDSDELFDSNEPFDDAVPGAFAQILISTTNDDPAGSPTWSDFLPFFSADFSTRAAKFKLEASVPSGNYQIKIDELSVDIDMPDLIQEDSDQTISESGETITFAQKFMAIPSIGITIEDMQQGDYYELSNISVSSFDIVVKNAGSGVARTISYIAKRY